MFIIFSYNNILGLLWQEYASWLDETIDIPFDEDLFLKELNKRRKL